MPSPVELGPNHARFLPGQRRGHYESFFQRANHPSRPLAFWIRYTLFSPADRPDAGLGELWAIVFDGESGAHVAVKREVPIARAHFDRFSFDVRVDEARLGPGSLKGAILSAKDGHSVSWDLRYRSAGPPLFLFPLALYETQIPKAKQLTASPLAVFEGSVTVDGRAIDVGGWVGAQSHNWGWKQTDEYAWVQVAGFDGHERTFLEMGTGRIKLGPVWSPRLTPVVLRHEGRDHLLHGVVQAARNHASHDWNSLRFDAEDHALRIEGHVRASREDFVGLAYADPPGGVKQCLNTKIASCDLTLTHRTDPGRGRVEQLSARRRAALEILTDGGDHGVEIRA